MYTELLTSGRLNTYLADINEQATEQMLLLTQQIERDMGRTKKSVNGKSVNGKSVNGKSVNVEYADRPIDIDILLYDDLIVDEPDLKIPHPLMHERDFVMIPLNEISEI